MSNSTHGTQTKHVGKKETEKGNNVKVVVRCRPMNEEEKKRQCASVIQCESSRKEVAVNIDNEKLTAFYFDRVFDHTASQEFVYRSVVADSVEDAIKGLNCTVFAYGQTGTGKTFTMEGKRTKCKDKSSPFWYGDQAGMIPRAAQHIFQRLGACEIPYKITVSYTELYNNEIIDLLADGSTGKQLSIRTDEGRKGCSIAGLSQVRVQSPEDIFRILEVAGNKRNVAETLLNSRSSRSHCIFTVTIQTKEPSRTGESIKKSGKLNLVDLAGSENTKRSGVEDQRKVEAAMINKSLLSLRRVITALASNESYVPFRDSHLTRLLQESLGGKSKTCMIATISTADNCLEETKSTLQYAFSAKSIKNAPVLSNTLNKSAQLQEYKEHIQTLQNQLAASRSEEGFYVDQKTWDYHLQLVEKITEIENTILEKDQLIVELQQLCDNQAIELELSKKQIKQIKIEVFQTRESLEDLSKQLELSKHKLQEQIDLVAQQQNFEEKLRNENQKSICALHESTNDIELLHKKSLQCQSIYVSNEATQDQLLSNIQKYLNCLKETLNTLEESSSSHKSTLLSKFSLLDIEFDVLNTKLVDATKTCSDLLSKQSRCFMSLFDQVQQDRETSFTQRYSHSQAMAEDYKMNSNCYTEQICEKLTSIVTQGSQYDDSLRVTQNSFAESFQQAKQQSTELLQENKKILSNIQKTNNVFVEEFTQHYEKQLNFLELSRKKYNQAMIASKIKFLHQMEEIYDRNVVAQQNEFEQRICAFKESLSTSYENAIEFQKECDQLCHQIIDHQTDQEDLEENTSEAFENLAAKLLDQISVFSGNKEILVSHLQEVLQQADKETQHKWLSFLQKSQEKYSEFSELLKILRGQFGTNLRDCRKRIGESIEKQFSRPISDIQQALDDSVLPKQIGFSEKKIHEHIQMQRKEANFLCSAVQKTSQTRPHPLVASGGTPKKEKVYSFPTVIPATIAKDEIIRLRKAGEIEFQKPEELTPVDVVQQSTTKDIGNESTSPTHSQENISPNIVRSSNQAALRQPKQNPLKRKRTNVTSQRTKSSTSTSVKRRKLDANK